MKRQMRACVAASLMPALLTLGRPDCAFAQPTIDVPVVVIGISVSIWPAIIARDKGFFQAQGLEVDFVDSGASARSVQQVAAGSATSESLRDEPRRCGEEARSEWPARESSHRRDRAALDRRAEKRRRSSL